MIIINIVQKFLNKQIYFCHCENNDILALKIFFSVQIVVFVDVRCSSRRCKLVDFYAIRLSFSCSQEKERNDKSELLVERDRGKPSPSQNGDGVECTNSQFIYYIRPVVSDMSKQSQDATTLCNVGEKRERALQLAAFQQHLELVVTDVMETCQRLRFEQKRMNPHPHPAHHQPSSSSATVQSAHDQSSSSSQQYCTFS